VDDAESDRVKADIKAVDQLGNILVMVHGITRDSLTFLLNATSAVKGPVSEVAEKALKGKALSHGVGQVQSLISKLELRLTSQLASGPQSYMKSIPGPSPN
jgi:hypothetical protein